MIEQMCSDAHSITLTDVKLGQEIHKEHDFHSLHCVHNSMFKVIDHLLTLSHILYWNKMEMQVPH